MAGLTNFEQEVQQVNSVLGNLKLELYEALYATKKIDAEFQEGAADTQKLNDRLKSVHLTSEQLELSEKELLRTHKQLNKTVAKANVESKKEGRELAKVKVLRQQQNQVIKNEILLKQGATKEGKKLNKTLRRQREELMKMRGTSGKLRGALKSVIGGFVGITAVVYGAIKAIGGIIKLNADFQKSLSSLSAITGATGDDLQFFAEQAKETSKVTLQGANDIVKAYELVGSARPELLKNKEALAEVTEQAIILSEATGGKLGLVESAKAVTSTLNQMEMGAERASEVINVLAAGSKFGSGNVVFLSEAMEKAGTTANIMGLSVQETIGAVETIAPFYDKAAMAGNSFDKVLLKLQEQQIGYASGTFDLNDAIDELRGMYKKGKSAASIFGVEHAKLGTLLVKNQHKFNEYTDAVTGTTTALEQQATQNDNLSANWKRLTNIIKNAFILTEGGGFLNNIVKSLINLSQKVAEFRNSFVENFNDLIRQSSIFRAVIATVTNTVRLNFKGMITSILIVVDSFKILIGVIKDALTGKLNKIGGTVKAQLQSIKNRVVDMGTAFIDAGKDIGAAFRGDDIEKYLMKTKDATISAENRVLSFSSTVQEENKKMGLSEEELEKKRKKAAAEAKKREQERLNRIKKYNNDVDKFASEEIKKNKNKLLRKEIDEETFAMNMLEIQATFLTLKKQNKELTDAEILELDQKLLDAQLAMSDMRVEKAEEEAEKILEIKEQTNQTLIDIGNALFDVGRNLLDQELADLEAQEEYKLSLVGDNEQAQQRIRDDFARKKAQVQRRAAIVDKLQALFNAGINTAVAITAALPNVVLAALVGVLGAVQIAAIASKPLPKFVHGVEDFEGGPAIVGEQGRELLITPSGNTYLTPDHATKMLIPSGSDVIPNYETEKMIQGGATPERFEELISETKKTRKAIMNRPIKETRITREGFKKVMKHNNSTTEYLDIYMRS